MPRLQQPSQQRLGSRLFAIGAAVLLFNLGGVGLIGAGRSIIAGDIEKRLGGLLLLLACLALLASSVVQGRYAWRGWAEPVERRGMRILRLGGIGFLLWAMTGTTAIIVWYRVIALRDAGLAPMFAFFSAPIGALLGGIYGGMTAHRQD